MFLNGYVKASNKLLRAVLADIQSVPLLAGVRALGILHRQFTDQFWRIMESPDIHIIDLGHYIKTAYDALGKWKDDASPLLDKDMSPIFVKPDGDVKPKKDHVFDSLYADAGDEMNMLTKQALEVCCASMFVVMERRYSDYLEGKYSGDVSEEVYNETRKTLKTNKVGENDFGFWDWVKKNSESIGVMAAEGKVMFKRNKTASWLRQLKIHNNDRYKMVMKQARTKGRRWAKQYRERSLGNERVKAARLEANRKNHEEMKNKLLNQHKERATFVAKYGVLKNGNDVDNVMKTFKSNAAKTKALKTYICFVKDLHHQQLADTVDKSLWVFSQKGKQLSVEQLSINLGQLLLKMQEFQLSMMEPLVLEYERCAEESDSDSPPSPKRPRRQSSSDSETVASDVSLSDPDEEQSDSENVLSDSDTSDNESE